MADQEGEFSFGTRLGLAFTTQSACCSALLVSGLLFYILYSAVVIKRGATRTWKVSTQVHCYFVNLLIFDLIQAIGGVIDAKWVAEAGVTEGPLCTAQGILKQMGDVGVALSSAIIALHTFCVLVLRRNAPPPVAAAVLILIWIFIALIVGLSVSTHKGQDYYGNTEYWCWITSRYGFQRIALEYFWLWLAAFINLVCYGIMALVVKGVVVVDGTRFRFIGWKGSSQNGVGSFSKVDKLTGADAIQSNAIAMRMLFYPLIYILAVTPITVVRFMAFSGSDVPFPATAFASITFSSSGVFNVILFAMTRPKLLPHRVERTPPRHFSFSVGLGPPPLPPLPHSPLRKTYSSIDSGEGPSWKMTPPMMPSELPLLHTHS
ncbi:hypothetical protein F5050DRAFT_17484 [Lentinula boryana]|uniref:Glucose receptor Git3 N-terminal domain-containing protein n=1 Tax=Lentinula boryana TaxID=40481 RepID=A0ABQ8QVT5_9AGAR|nr:hypothetical protein F5050DRAFT_17484 [Lentinula boryana]